MPLTDKTAEALEDFRKEVKEAKLFRKTSTPYGGKYELGTEKFNLAWGTTEFEKYFGVSFRRERFLGFVLAHN
jgi:hypothetical protein